MIYRYSLFIYIYLYQLNSTASSPLFIIRGLLRFTNCLLIAIWNRSHAPPCPLHMSRCPRRLRPLLKPGGVILWNTWFRNSVFRSTRWGIGWKGNEADLDSYPEVVGYPSLKKGDWLHLTQLHPDFSGASFCCSFQELVSSPFIWGMGFFHRNRLFSGNEDGFDPMGFNTMKKHHYLVGRFLSFWCQKTGGLQRNGHPKKGAFKYGDTARVVRFSGICVWWC